MRFRGNAGGVRNRNVYLLLPIKIYWAVLAVLLVPLAFVSAGDWAEPGKVQDVLAGRLDEANAAWWGFDAEDSTEYLSKAIESGASKVIVPNMGQDWVIDSAIWIRRENLEILFEPGVVLTGKKGSLIGLGAGLFRIANSKNIILSGYGAKFKMHREDYTRQPYERGEWRHQITIVGSENVQVLGLTLEGSGGDGLYIGSTRERDYSSDIVVRDLEIRGQYRQGISVISVDNLLIENTILRDTFGTAPRAGIDFEPNRPAQRLSNIIMRNVVAENNAWAGFLIYLAHMSDESVPVSMRFENCVSRNDFDGISIWRIDEGSVRGKIEFINTVVENPRNRALDIKNKWAGVEVSFVNCEFRGSRREPFIFENVQGVEFRDSVVEDWMDRPFIVMDNTRHVSDLTGGILVRSPYPGSAGRELKEILAGMGLDTGFERYETAQPRAVHFEVPELMPLSGALPEKAPDPVPLRHSSAYVIYAARGERVDLDIEAGPSGGRVDIEIAYPSGRTMRTFSLEEGETRNVVFNAREAGVYAIGCAAPQPGNITKIRTRNRLSVLAHSIWRPGGLDEKPSVSSRGDLYFWVPAGAEKFYVKVMAEARDRPVNASIFSPEGLVVAWRAGIPHRNWEAFEVDRADASKGEVWSIRVDSAAILPEGENIGALIKLYEPIPPVFSFHPDALLIPVE